MIIKKTDELFSIMKIDKRSRIFSTNENYFNENIENKLENNNKDNDNKKVFERDRKKKYSLLKRTTSEPNLNVEDNNDKNNIEEDEYSGLGVKKNNKKIKNKKKIIKKDDNNNQKIIFDYPLNEIYFQYFEDFLEELIKKTYPEKYNLKKKNSNASYKNSLDNNSNKNSIDRNSSTNNSIDMKEIN